MLHIKITVLLQTKITVVREHIMDALNEKIKKSATISG